MRKSTSSRAVTDMKSRVRCSVVAALALLSMGCGETERDRGPVCAAAWQPLALPASLTGAHRGEAVRSGHQALWTGAELVVWGGTTASPQGVVWSGGRNYRALPEEGAPPADGWHVLAWQDGSVVVGERSIATFDLDSDTWSELPAIPTRGDMVTAAAVTGADLVVAWTMRGVDSLGPSYWHYLPDGEWQELPNAYPREGVIPLVSIGDEVMTWGLGHPEYPEDNLSLGVRYRPASETWQLVSAEGEPSRRHSHVLVWTGSEAIIWGGHADEVGDTLTDGARYDPERDEWEAMNTEGAPVLRAESAVAAGRKMVVYGLLGEDQRGGAVYDVDTDSWSDLTMKCGPSADLLGTSLTWIDSGLVLWGGQTWCDGDGGWALCADNRERAWFLSASAAMGETPDDAPDCRCPGPL